MIKIIQDEYNKGLLFILVDIYVYYLYIKPASGLTFYMHYMHTT